MWKAAQSNPLWAAFVERIMLVPASTKSAASNHRDLEDDTRFLPVFYARLVFKSGFGIIKLISAVGCPETEAVGWAKLPTAGYGFTRTIAGGTKL